jgi:hypothetical protein
MSPKETATETPNVNPLFKLIQYQVKRIVTNDDNEQVWNLVKDKKNFTYDDKLIVGFNSSVKLSELDEKEIKAHKKALIEYFNMKAESISLEMKILKKDLQVNFKAETNGLVEGSYSPTENFIKCFGVLSYAKGSSVMTQLNY